MKSRNGRGRWKALALATALGACRRDSAPPIVIEADTTRGRFVTPAAGTPEPEAAEPEVVVIEERVPPPARAAEAEPRATGADPARDERTAATPDLEPLVSEDAPDAPSYVLPAGTRIALELRTPLHSASTRVGDRFAARTTAPVEIGGRMALATGALVEGRVAQVVPADGDAGGAIELDFQSLVLPNGERVPLEVEIASVAGRPAEPVRRAGAGEMVGGAAAGAGVGAVLGGRRGAAIGAAVGVLGTVLVAGARDHEVVVPSGTEIEITTTAPLEVPAP